MTDEDDRQSSGGKLVQNLSQKSLQPFINTEKTAVHFEPIICYDGNQKKVEYPMPSSWPNKK